MMRVLPSEAGAGDANCAILAVGGRLLPAPLRKSLRQLSLQDCHESCPLLLVQAPKQGAAPRSLQGDRPRAVPRTRPANAFHALPGFSPANTTPRYIRKL